MHLAMVLVNVVGGVGLVYGVWAAVAERRAR
jgi:hypothetical protein